eukprot:5276335-Pleurochrysis_carterae.AAC.3
MGTEYGETRGTGFGARRAKIGRKRSYLGAEIPNCKTCSVKGRRITAHKFRPSQKESLRGTNELHPLASTRRKRRSSCIDEATVGRSAHNGYARIRGDCKRSMQDDERVEFDGVEFAPISKSDAVGTTYQAR